MNAQSKLIAFDLTCERASSLEALKSSWFALARWFGFSHVELCWGLETYRAGGAHGAVHNYPAGWQELAHDSSEGLNNPIHRFAISTDCPFSWTDPIFVSQCGQRDRAFFNALAAMGLTHGWTAPVRGHDGQKACVSFTPANAPASASTDRLCLAAMTWSGLSLYAAIRRLKIGAPSPKPSATLTRRERECLELVALGLRDKGVAKRLGIMPRTAHNHIERAKRKLGASNRVQAVQIWRRLSPL